MGRKIIRYIALAAIVLISIHFVYSRASTFFYNRQADARYNARHQLTLITNRVYHVDTNLLASAQVFCMDGQPVQAELLVYLQYADNHMGAFSTDHTGTALIDLPLENLSQGAHVLNINISSSIGRESFSQTVHITRPEGETLIIHFDKGLYKPGDDVLFRILAVNSQTAEPFADGNFTISIYDGNDNRVFVQNATTSDFGIMSGRFRLGDEVNSGRYRLVVERDGIFQEQAFFEVEPYVLPLFEITLDTDLPQYNVGDTIYLTGNARYFFDEPVNQGTVSIYINGERVLDGAELGPNGEFALEHEVTTARTYNFLVEIIDNSNHRVEETLHVRVVDGPLSIEMLPEHGYLVEGIPNRVYVFANRPDGTPIAANLQVSSDHFSRQVIVDESGMGMFVLEDVRSNNRIDVRAMDVDGNIIESYFRFAGIARPVTLGVNKPRFAMGETIYLELNSSEYGGVFMVYAYRNDRLLYMLTTRDNQVRLNLGSEYGLIDIYAVWVASYDTRDHRYLPHARKTVFVDPGHLMQLTVESDRPEYRPGEFVNLNIGVADEAGNPLTAALLVSIVDEAMLSLAANDLSICNIRLALADIRFSEGLDAATLYASLIAGASEQAITRILLRQGATAHGLQTAQLINPGHTTARRMGGGQVALTIYLLVLAAVLFFGLREPKRHTPTYAYPLMPGYTPNAPFPGHEPHDDNPKEDQVATWVIFVALVLVAVALLFLQSCGSAADDAVTEADHAPVPEAPAWDMDDTADEVHYDSEPHFEPGADRPVGEIQTQTARVRRLFLETMLFIPELVARDGHGELAFILADNITTWNIQVVGNTQDGIVGHAESSIRAFQPFFVDFQLPMNAIRHDRISIPVTVFNYTEAEQTVILTIAELDWFTLHGDAAHVLKVPQGQSQMIYIPITINDFGNFVFRVYADTHDFADAAERGLRVNPEGFRIERVVTSGTIERSLTQPLVFMGEDIPDTRRAIVKFYPSVMAQVVEGMENIFRMPFGCFEQTSSILFPNILALRYMRDAGIDDPVINARALEFISSGYQRLLTFEVGGVPGGFSLFGYYPAETVLTAYGLMQLKNLTSVYTIDERVMDRMLEFLFRHQNSDGSFEITGSWWWADPVMDFIFSAYITWAISEAFPHDFRLQSSVDYLTANLHMADDNFTLALIANTLVNTGSPRAQEVVDGLLANVQTSGNVAYLTSGSTDYFGTHGHAQNLQTTALASLAFSRLGVHATTNALLMNHIIANTDAWGTWHSTQATILSLMALTSFASAAPLQDGQITITIGAEVRTIDVSGDNTLDMYQVVFTGLERENEMEIHFPNLGRMTYKVVLEHFVPYDSVELDRGFLLTSNMRTQLNVNERVEQEIRVVNTSGRMINNAMVTISIPQGFRVEGASLSELRARGIVERYETRFEVVNLYFRDIEYGEVIDLVVAYRPSFPVDVTGGHVRAFDYYNPTVEGYLMPVGILVE